jgi:hypothetical protein
VNSETLAGPYGPYFDSLSLPAQLAVRRYLEAMKRIFPDLADQAVAGPGNEGTVYVYIPLPSDDELNIEIHEAMAEVGAQIVVDTGIVIVLMPSSLESPAGSPS